MKAVRTKAVKDKMPKLRRIIALWNVRCNEISDRAEDQLRSMGDETEWQKFYETAENPFKSRSVSRPLFMEEEPIVEQVERKPKTSSTTQRSTTDRSTTTQKAKENAGYQPVAPKGRSDQPILIKPLYRIGLSDAHPRLEYQSQTQQWTEPAYLTRSIKLRCRGTRCLGRSAQFWMSSVCPLER